ncbi:MAG TPA: polysaccharide deacetylase family protein [Hyphomicrobium sp.]
MRHNRFRFPAIVACLISMISGASAECADPKTALGVSRTVEIDSSKGGNYGSVSRQAKEPSFLQPKEVVLTFDDGPMPWITRSILDTLDRFCTKATFFEVGQMALEHPTVTQEILNRGHTLGTHTMTHPFNLPRMAEASATDEIERGIAAVALAAGGPVAPFFRFPGLADSAALISYLRGRGIVVFTVDVVSNDSYIPDKSRLIARTLAVVDQHKGGIILFHDIKAVTAKALPDILAGLKARGYSVVHMQPKEPVQLLPDVVAEVTIDAGKTRRRRKIPFYASVEPDRSATTAALRGYIKKKAAAGKRQSSDEGRRKRQRKYWAAHHHRSARRTSRKAAK